MCSRYTLTSPPEAVRTLFGYANDAGFPPRYNIAPSQPVAIVRHGLRGQRGLALVRWGLIPPWVKDPMNFAMLINARAETADVKPSFRSALRHRRCLVPADGFYEWTGRAGAKQPHLIKPKNGGLIALAGLWEHWLGADGSELETMAILTTTANAEMAAIHERMPVILTPDQFDEWLDCRSGRSQEAKKLLSPLPDRSLEITLVSKDLNNPRNDFPEVQRNMPDTLL
ncbi:putative SOS response-associated peptidase YoqW [Candidatus Filomicrobium marinum]|uniref:Abasic site processing protein n=1 Tax=Candidatus Filomicrobium marinum TaxID=1608628 RepID=A0A0D6J9H2_9HYPH|nr:SOS response-associated peptidase [Candidatus Filomicrobium marinum]CFW98447.1 putative SOS response-associated peptidase YoqW [Candidatus Filomicrobium marinum]CPR14901.1 putative SOS response-associated peptidase YoqW [Candidatus Filomicrobium marinum]